MPELTPIPPPPNPLQTLSGIMGIKQQQQALQTGQYNQATAQAESQQAQQKNAELQAVGNLTKNAYNPRYSKPDGTFDNQAFADDVSRVAPTYGQQIADDATARAGQIYQNKQILFNMEKSKRDTVVNTLGALAVKDDVHPADVSTAMTNLQQQFPDDRDISTLTHSMVGAVPNNVSGKPLQQVLQQMAMQANVPSAPLSMPDQTTNAAGQIVNRNKVTGALTAPQLGGGATNPASPQVAGQTAANTSRAAGSGNADIDASNNVAAAQRDARTNIDLTNRIDQLADAVNPGSTPAKVSSILGGLGLQDVNQARTELQKDLGRLRGAVATRAGSDSRAGEVLAGLPTDTTPTQTIHQAMDFARGTAKQDLALGALRDRNSKATGGNMNGFQGDYAHATAVASPLMHEYLSLSPSDQVGFFQRNFKTKAEAQAFRAQAQAAKKMSPDAFQ
jgi:hypothetical protein